MFGPEIHAGGDLSLQCRTECVVLGGWHKHAVCRASDCAVGYRAMELRTEGHLRQDVRVATMRLLSEVRTAKHHDIHSGRGDGAVFNPQRSQVPHHLSRSTHLSCILMVPRQRMESPRALPQGFLPALPSRQVYKSYAAHPRRHDDLYALMIRLPLDTAQG